jgi:hypothetical protein
MGEVNGWVVVLAGVLALVLGFVWMSVIWKKPYRTHMYGLAKDVESVGLSKRAKIEAFVLYILISMVTAFVYGWLLGIWKVAAPNVGMDGHSLGDATVFTLFVWAGLTWPFTFGKRLWQFKSWHVVAIDTSYELLRFMLFLVLFWTLG